MTILQVQSIHFNSNFSATLCISLEVHHFHQNYSYFCLKCPHDRFPSFVKVKEWGKMCFQLSKFGWDSHRFCHLCSVSYMRRSGTPKCPAFDKSWLGSLAHAISVWEEGRRGAVSWAFCNSRSQNTVIL